MGRSPIIVGRPTTIDARPGCPYLPRMGPIEEESLFGGRSEAQATLKMIERVGAERQFRRDEATVADALAFLEGFYGLPNHLTVQPASFSNIRDHYNFSQRRWRICGAEWALKHPLSSS